MRSLFIRSPWSGVHRGIIAGAIVTGWLVMMNSGLGQEAPAPAQDNKPAASSEKKPASDSSGGRRPDMAEMMKKMMGQPRGGNSGGMMGAMGGAANPTGP